MQTNKAEILAIKE
ncbi:hypothetical protein KIPB_010469, partial [Kipferlia bialata]|eukprot:g10469.t1